MSQVKISQLPQINTINANTANTLFAGVDIPTSATFQMTAHVLAQGLYSNEVLNVGQNSNTLPNTVAQFVSGAQSYIQTNLVNNNDGGSADYVITANAGSGGTDTTNFIDMGYANKNYQPGNEYNNIGTAISPLDGYIYVQGTQGSLGGNLAIGTVTSNTTMRFIVGGGTAANIVATMTSNSLVLNTQSFITFADGTKQSTASLSNAYSTGVNSTQNTSIQLAWNLANTALQNTATIVVNNNLTVPGVFSTSNVIATNGIIQFNNSNFQQNTTFVQITASNNYTTFAPSNTNYMLQVTGKANSVTRVVIDSFGQNTYPTIIGRMGRGSAGAPSATQNNDIMMRVVGNGYTGTQFPSSSPTKIDFVASENFSDTNKGTQIQFWNTPIGSNTIQKIATFNADSITFSGVVSPQKGFIYTPNIYPSSQTAITIDFANNSVIRAQTATGLTVSLTNFVVGKVVEAWITNTAVGNQTLTHGVSATNSTVNSTTYTIPGTSTIFVKYWTMDGTLANTFCAVIHA
jgi:hypothetical protein